MSTITILYRDICNETAGNLYRSMKQGKATQSILMIAK
jgi:hypothetical protein